MLTLFCHGEIEFHSKSACFWEIELLRWFWYTVMLGSTLKQPVSVQSSCLPGQNDLFYALLWCLEFHQYRLLPRPFRVFLARLFFPASNPPGESLKSTLAGTWDGLIRDQSLAETRGCLRLESKGDRRREASEAGLSLRHNVATFAVTLGVVLPISKEALALCSWVKRERAISPLLSKGRHANWVSWCASWSIIRWKLGSEFA